MKFCRKCGAAIEEGDMFCEVCGNPVPKSSAPAKPADVPAAKPVVPAAQPVDSLHAKPIVPAISQPAEPYKPKIPEKAPSVKGKSGMDVRIEKYIEKVDSAKEAQKKRELDRALIAAGLYDKEYNTSGSFDQSYTEWDNKYQCYYKKAPLELTEQEREAFEKAYAKSQEGRVVRPGKPAKNLDGTYVESRNEGISILLIIFAIIFFLAGFILFVTNIGGSSSSYGYYGSDLNAVIAWVGLFLGCFNGTLLLGFARVINLLSSIDSKTGKK